MSSIRLYLALESPWTDSPEPDHTRSFAAWINKDCSFLRTPGRRCWACYWCITQEETTLPLSHVTQGQQQLWGNSKNWHHKMDRYSWNILGLLRWKSFGETTDEGQFSSVEKRINIGMALDFLFIRTLWTLSWDVAQSPACLSPSTWRQFLLTSQ